MYDLRSDWFVVTKDFHFDEAHCYYKGELKSQNFADNEWSKDDDELFADLTDIIDANEPILELNSISDKAFEKNLYYEESRLSSLLSDIPDLLGHEEEEIKNVMVNDHPRWETEEKSYLELSRRDKNSSIQLSKIFPKLCF